MKRAPAVLGVSLVIAGSLCACTDETNFTAEERDILATYKLLATPPANPSNRVADDQAAAALGKKFFFDKRFSGALGTANDGASGGSLGKAGDLQKVACFDCHQLDLGGADRRSRTPTSLGSNYGLRNAPTVINSAFWDVAAGGWQLWDGKKDSLWALALGPLEGANEHNGSRLQYAHLIYDIPSYRAAYESTFGAMPPMDETTDGQPKALDGSNWRFKPAGKPTPAGATPGPINIPFDMMPMADKALINRVYSNIGKALEAYERLLISSNFEPSPFDRMLAGDDAAMSPAATRGARLFVGKAACNECHRGHLFTDFKFHNIGCPQQGSNVPALDVGRQNGIKLVKADVMNRAGAYSDMQDDSHLVNLMEQEFDLGAFRTPTLRNIERTGPYMHDGVYTNLWDVVSHYNFGGGTGSFSGAKEAAISPLLLSNDEMDDLVEFLRSLTDGPARPMSDFPEGLLAAPTLP